MTTLGEVAHSIPVSIFPDPEALAEALAGVLLAEIVEAAREGHRCLLGCPGGRSPRATYRALGRLAAASGSDLSHLVIVMMDEYAFLQAGGFVNCPADAHYSCHRAAEQEIVGVINAGLEPERRILAESVWFPDPADPGAYDERIQAAGGVDLFIVATGAGDGHVAFNPPGSPADSPTRIVEIAQSTRRDNLRTFPQFADIDEVPAYGVGVGLGTIAELSRQVVLIAHGEDKQYAVRRLAGYDDWEAEWPASIIYRCRGAQVMIDEAAARGLESPTPCPLPLQGRGSEGTKRKAEAP
jgi:glucosamine-6-phosphate deaminase